MGKCISLMHMNESTASNTTLTVSRLDGGETLTVSLLDGTAHMLSVGSTVADLTKLLGHQKARTALFALVDGVERDLSTCLSDEATVEIITKESSRALPLIRHSTAHVLAQAVLDLYPGATFAIGPPIENGFYYDFELPDGAVFVDDDLERITTRMKEIIAEDQPFVRFEINADEALDIFADHKYKCEIIKTVTDRTDLGDLDSEITDGHKVSCYRNGHNDDSFVDLCRGPHVPSTGQLGYFSLQRVSGAYWRGDERNPMLQRIYGTAWATEGDLKRHMKHLIEAEKRDHRRLAVELDLLSWPPELGPGLAVWHPKGALVRKIMEDYSRQRHEQGGYEFVVSPHLAKANLWETSGHLDFYSESMFPAMELDGSSYYTKPMNCPFHIMIYRSRQRSYRELPMRLFELGAVYRYERSGVIHGLLRSRGFTQDDSHIFCTRSSVGSELESLLQFVLSVLRAFGFEEFQAKLSTRPESKSVGEASLWDTATSGLRSALETAKLDYVIDEGGGAFYGPKIDVDVKDALGRAWQLSTIQLDFNLPQRFDLEYVAADGTRQQPIMIHRALFGSLERFFGVLLEHYAGAFPVWLAPVQVQILPVAAVHSDYASSLVSELQEEGFRAEVIAADEPLGRRVRTAKLAKIPYILVVGDTDVRNGTVGINTRGDNKVERDTGFIDFMDRLHADVCQPAQSDPTSR